MTHATISAIFPRARTLIHPGPFNPVRIQRKHSASARHVRLSLEPGLSLYEALVRPLAAMDIRSASITLLGGLFESATYCLGPRDPSRRAIVAYGAPIDAGRTFMVFGNATLGKDMRGEPIVHCHACIRTAEGLVKGGHIITQACIVGPVPVVVFVTSLDGFELRVAFDAETNIPLIQPLEKESNG